MTQAIGDTGSTHVLLHPDCAALPAVHTVAHKPLAVQFPDGNIVHSIGSAVLTANQVAVPVSIMRPTDLDQPLLGTDPFTAQGCSASLDQSTLEIRRADGAVCIRGVKLPGSKLYTIDLGSVNPTGPPHRPLRVPLARSPAVAPPRLTPPDDAEDDGFALLAQRFESTQEEVNHLQAVLGSAPKETILRAVRMGWIDKWTTLTYQQISQHMRDTPATHAGHMRELRGGIKSTKPPQVAPVAPSWWSPRDVVDDDIRSLPPAYAFVRSRKTNHVLYADSKYQRRVSEAGFTHEWIMVYNNYIIVVPIIGQDGAAVADAHAQGLTHIEEAGKHHPEFTRIDNISSPALNALLVRRGLTLEYCAVGINRANRAEKAIQDFECAELSTLYTADITYPEAHWDKLTHQVQLVINHLKPWALDPSLCAWEGLHGRKYDYDAHPLTVAGASVSRQVDKKHRTVDAPWKAVAAFYVGPAEKHYRTADILVVNRGGAYEVQQEQQFDVHLPDRFRVPRLGPVHELVAEVRKLTAALKKGPSANQSALQPILHRLQLVLDTVPQTAGNPADRNAAAAQRVPAVAPPLPPIAPAGPDLPPPAADHRAVAVQRVPNVGHPLAPVLAAPVPPVILPLPPPPAPAAPRRGARVDYKQLSTGRATARTASAVVSSEDEWRDDAPHWQRCPAAVSDMWRTPAAEQRVGSTTPPLRNGALAAAAVVACATLGSLQPTYVNLTVYAPPPTCDANAVVDALIDQARQGNWSALFVDAPPHAAATACGALDVPEHLLDGSDDGPPDYDDDDVDDVYWDARSDRGEARAALNLNPDGSKLTFPSAKRGEHGEKWVLANDNEFRKLIADTKTMHGIASASIPTDRRRDISYYNPQVKEKYKPLDIEPDGVQRRVRGTFGGDRSSYTGRKSAKTAELEAVKGLMTAAVHEKAHLTAADIKDFYLAEPMERAEYLKIPVRLFSDAILDELALRPYIENGFIHMEVVRTMYGLPQAGLLAQIGLVKLLNANGYIEDSIIPMLFTHRTNGIIFTLVVDDFLIKWRTQESIDHLLGVLRSKYEITSDIAASKYLGMTIEYDRARQYLRLSMPGYIAKVLQQFQHRIITPQQSPGVYVPPRYGSQPQEIKVDTSRPLDAAELLELQSIVGSCLYYCRAVDYTGLQKTCQLSSEQAQATEQTLLSAHRLLGYFMAYPDNALEFRQSDMILRHISDASFMSRSKGRSVAGGLHYVTDAAGNINGGICAVSTIIGVVVASAYEAEVAAAYINGCVASHLHNIFSALGYPQQATELLTDNQVAVGFANDTIQHSKSKSIDGRFHWIRDRVRQGQLRIGWIPGVDNIADFFTKDLPIHEHNRWMTNLVYTPPGHVMFRKIQKRPRVVTSKS